jgi:hypothetical protein
MPNVSVAISAAITAYARAEMIQYIAKHSADIYAIDTDGIKIGSELDPKLVGPELGQMKFEGEFSEAVFLAPKVYGGIQQIVLPDSSSNSQTLPIESLDGDTSTNKSKASSKLVMIVKIKGVKNPVSY